MAQHGKTYREALAKVDREREYAPADAVSLVKSLPGPKFPSRSRSTSAPG